MVMCIARTVPTVPQDLNHPQAALPAMLALAASKTRTICQAAYTAMRAGILWKARTLACSANPDTSAKVQLSLLILLAEEHSWLLVGVNETFSGRIKAILVHPDTTAPSEPKRSWLALWVPTSHLKRSSLKHRARSAPQRLMEARSALLNAILAKDPRMLNKDHRAASASASTGSTCGISELVYARQAMCHLMALKQTRTPTLTARRWCTTDVKRRRSSTRTASAGRPQTAVTNVMALTANFRPVWASVDARTA
jgi:hypothetical protein